MYKIEVLIATMHKENKEDIINLLKNMNVDSDSVVVSQCNKDDVEKFKYKNYNVTCVYSTERGLSRSRNCALRYASADVVVIADDDMRYIDGYKNIVLNAYNTYFDDILTFQVNDKKKYHITERKLNKILIHKVSSYEITLKLKSISEKFNIYFGTGSSYFQAGEENIFLSGCIRRGNTIRYIPSKIASLTDNRPSTWFTGFNEKYFLDKGAIYYQLSRFLAIPYILQFAIRKYELYRGKVGFFSAIYYMICGIKVCKKLKIRQYGKYTK